MKLHSTKLATVLSILTAAMEAGVLSGCSTDDGSSWRVSGTIMVDSQVVIQDYGGLTVLAYFGGECAKDVDLASLEDPRRAGFTTEIADVLFPYSYSVGRWGNPSHPGGCVIAWLSQWVSGATPSVGDAVGVAPFVLSSPHNSSADATGVDITLYNWTE